jgi:hypothetical protein
MLLTSFILNSDGPNVAYYMQNFEEGIFNYHQIKFVVDALEEMGENVLVRRMNVSFSYGQPSIKDGLTFTIFFTIFANLGGFATKIHSRQLHYRQFLR